MGVKEDQRHGYHQPLLPTPAIEVWGGGPGRISARFPLTQSKAVLEALG